MKISQDELKTITETVLRILKSDQIKKKEEDKDWRLRNTRLLLKNYRMLKAHCQEGNEEVEGTVKEWQEEFSEFGDVLFRPEELSLKSALLFKTKTRKMLNYFEIMFGTYGKFCEEQGELAKRRFDIISKMYISGYQYKVEQAMVLHGVEQRTIYKDISKAEEELSIFLFGVDSLDDLNAKTMQH